MFIDDEDEDGEFWKVRGLIVMGLRFDVLEDEGVVCEDLFVRLGVGGFGLFKIFIIRKFDEWLCWLDIERDILVWILIGFWILLLEFFLGGFVCINLNLFFLILIIFGFWNFDFSFGILFYGFVVVL